MHLNPRQSDTWFSTIVGSRPRRLGEWEELTPAKAVEHAWRLHRERATYDLIFAMLGVFYRLLLGGAIAPSAAALITPAFVRRTAAPAVRSPEQPEHQQQDDTEPPFLRRVRSCEGAASLLTPASAEGTAAPPHREERLSERPKHQQQEDMEPPFPRRVRRHSSPGSFSPLAREVLQRKMLEHWGNTPKYVHEYSVQASLGG